MNRLALDAVIPRPEFDIAVGLSADPGRVLALVGPNGAGKSSVLAAIAGFTEMRGDLRLGTRDLTGEPPERRGIGFVFQDLLLFPHLTVEDNVAFPARVRGRSRTAARAEAAEWIERFDLSPLARRHPGALSGGQAQRVALARALAARPQALLLDEPLAALDVEIRDGVRADLARHLREFGGPTILVTHDAADVTVLADDVAILEAGRVVQRGSLAAIASRPETPWAARFATA